MNIINKCTLRRILQNNKSVDIPLMLSLLIETLAKRTFARGMHKILTVGSTLDSDNPLKPRNKIFCTIIHLNRDSACCDYALRCAAICSSNNFTFFSTSLRRDMFEYVLPSIQSLQHFLSQFFVI